MYIIMKNGLNEAETSIRSHCNNFMNGKYQVKRETCITLHSTLDWFLFMIVKNRVKVPILPNSDYFYNA